MDNTEAPGPVVDLAVSHQRYATLGLKPGQFSACLTDEGFTPPWRVATIDRGWCSLLGFDEGGQDTTVRVRTSDWDLAVGDWVLLSDRDEEPAVQRVLERDTYLRRASAGAAPQQWIAANLDTVFVVAAFGPTEKLERRGINARRLERYLSAVQEGGATPVVVLNKLDVAKRDAEQSLALCAELTSRFGVEVVAVSALDGDGLSALRSHLVAGETVAFVGPSGVGKSTLINVLMGREEAATSHVRAADMKGRHTTTRRELLPMPGGAILIDTPGMREFSVLLEGDTVPGFDDIQELAAQCRFSDCKHESEPGCVIMDAINEGSLPLDRLNSYRSIVRDAARTETKHDPKARHAQKKAGKQFGRLIKEAKALKKR